MARKLKYSSNIKDKGLLGKELKAAAELYAQGFSFERILADSIDNNVFQVNTERRRKELADCVITRMKYLDEFTLKRISDGTIFLANVISFYAVMKINPLVYEFMNEVYKEKAELMINRIDGICRKYQLFSGCVVENISFIPTISGVNGK